MGYEIKNSENPDISVSNNKTSYKSLSTDMLHFYTQN